MLRIALTGPSGGGKGYICALLKERGIPFLDTDRAVHALYEEKETALQIEALLGRDVSAKSGKVDRKKLGAIVYFDRGAMDKLLSFVYPKVKEICEAFFEECRRSGAKAAAIDAPQLFEAGMEKDVDLIICVTAPLRVRLRRVTARDGISEEEARLRFSRQKSQREYRRLSHHTIVNDGRSDPAPALEKILTRALAAKESASEAQKTDPERSRGEG